MPQIVLRAFLNIDALKGREYIPCYQNQDQVKSNLSWKQSTTYLLKKLQNNRHMEESTTGMEKIHIWKIELKIATSRCKKTVQQEQR